MGEMVKALHVRLSPEQTRRLHEWAAGHTAAEVVADSEPSGFHLEIGIGAGFPPFAEAIKGSDRIDLGDADVVLEEPK